MMLLYYDKCNIFYICTYTCNFMEKKNYFLGHLIIFVKMFSSQISRFQIACNLYAASLIINESEKF